MMEPALDETHHEGFRGRGCLRRGGVSERPGWRATGGHLVRAAALVMAYAAAGDALECPALVARLDGLDDRATTALVDSLTARWHADEAPEALADSLMGLSSCLVEAGALEPARRFAERARELVTELYGPDARATADAHAECMYVAFRRGDLAGAWHHQSEVVRIYSQLGVPPGELGDALFDLAYIATERSDPLEAEALWRRAGDALASVETPDHRLIALTESNRAEALRLIGAYARAESLMIAVIDRSTRHLERGSDHAKLLNNLGVFYWDQDRLDDAERLYRESLRIREATSPPDTAAIATALQNLGVLARDQGNGEEAERLLFRALDMARSSFAADDPNRAYFPLELGTLRAGHGRYEQALELWEEALAVVRRAETPRPLFEAKILVDIAEAYLAQSDPERASPLIERARRLRAGVLGEGHPLVAVCDVARARIAATRGEDDLATTLVTDALERLSRTDVAREARVRALVLDAEILRRAGDASGATNRMREAIDLIETLRGMRGGGDLARARLIERHLEAYERTIAWLVDDGRPHEALLLAERSRARALRDRLAAHDVDVLREVPRARREELLTREQAARARVNAARRVLRRLEDDAPDRARVEGELTEAARQLANVSNEIRLYSSSWLETLRTAAASDVIDRLAPLLSPNEALLFYELASERSFLFVLEHDGAVHVHELPITGPQLAEMLGGIGSTPVDAGLVAAARGVTGIGSVGTTATAPVGGSPCERLHEIHERLVPAAVRPLLRSLDTVTLVPDGAMHALPVEALVTASCDRGQERYWLDEYPVVRYAHSMGTWLELGERPRGRKGIEHVLSVSDPAFARTGTSETRGPATHARFRPLPGTGKETEVITDLYGASHVTALTGTAATETAVKRAARKADIVHLATHGVVEEDRDGLLAALVLAEPLAATESEDGFLHLFEVYELRLDCELAILSACDTKLGTQVGGEGVFALSRAFLAAGARRTVASLWAVDDEATSALISGFLRRVAASERASGAIPYARHLRDAKRDIRDDPRFASPYYWAPFVLTGLP